MNNGMREIVIDGNLCGNGTCRFRGLGAVVGDGFSSLLTDYRMKRPDAYREITEFLFKKNYGASLSHIRIECGSRMQYGKNKSEYITGNCGFVLAADAKRINKDLTVEFHFDFPADNFVENSEETFENEYKLCRDVISNAFEKYGLKADYISFDSDKSGTHVSEFVKYLKHRLNNELLYSYDYNNIKAAVYDTPEGILSSKMLADEELRNAVSVIGYGIIYSNENIKTLNEKYHKEIWRCDGKTIETVPELAVNTDGIGITGKNSLIDIMDNIIFSFNKYSSMYEYNPAVSACFPRWGSSLGGLIKADTPWSGHYSYNAAMWGAAHITHFTEPGWKYAACESGKDAYVGEYAVFISDDGDYTIVFVNSSDEPRKYSICVRNTDKSDEFVHCVETRGPEGCDNYSVNWFRVVDKIMPAENAEGCCYTLEVKPFSVMTCTTMPVDKVNGTESVKECEFANKVLPLPYSDNFSYSEETLNERDGKPFYAYVPYGKFEIIFADGGNVLVQKECVEKEGTCPAIIFGDDTWADYSVKTEVKFDNYSDNNYLGVGLRYNRSSLTKETGECGYQLRIYPDCRWQLRYMNEVLEEDVALETIIPSEWNQLKISAQGRRIKCYINKNLICEHIVSAPIILSGRACLYSAYCKNIFRNLSIFPIIGFSPYSVNFDCLCGKFTYSDGWVNNISAGAGFSNCTSVSNSKRNEYFEFEFSGETVALTGIATNLTLKVEIDNKIMTAGLFIDRCDIGQVFYLKENLGDGVHRLKLTVLSGKLEFDCAEVNVSDHLISKGKISRAIIEKKEAVPAKKLKKSTLLIGIGLAAAGAGALLLGGKIKKRRLKNKK